MTSALLNDIEIFKQVLETSQDSCWSIALPSFQLEYCNKESTERLFGYPVERYYSDPSFWFSLVYGPDKELAAAANDECMSRGSCEVKYRMTHQNGDVMWTLVRMRVIKDTEGNPIRIIGSSMDINDATIQEQRLKESEELFHSLATYAPIGIYITDVDGKCLYTNEYWRRTAGLTLEESMGDGWTRGIHPDDVERTFNEWNKAIEEHRNFHGQFRMVSQKRGTRFVDSRAAPIREAQGRIIAFVGTVEDITEKLENEKILNSQRERLVASSKMSSLGEMASGIAHEINNPLMIIVGLCSRIKRLSINDGEFALETIKNEIEKVENTTFRISKIIKGLRNFSRNSDKDPMEKVSMSRLIDDTLELSAQRFKDNHVDLQVDLGDCAQAEVMGRPSQLTQVLLNLLSNAFDAVESLPEKWVKILLKQIDNRIVITVIDSGKGIPRSILEKIMDPFFTTKEVGKGTGLGLSISKGILEEHDGKLFYDSCTGNTCFKIELNKSL